MPLNAVGWSPEEEEKLIDEVQPHSFLYNVFDPSRNNIIARESRWKEIAVALSKPVEECKKRWRGLRDSYIRSKRVGTAHKMKAKLQFLDTITSDAEEMKMDSTEELLVETDEPQQVITDKQEYYEITLVDTPQAQMPEQPAMKDVQFIQVLPSPCKTTTNVIGTRKKRTRKAGVSKTNIKLTTSNIQPIKILPKPLIMNGVQPSKLVQYVDDSKEIKNRSYSIDKLIERVLKESTNEVDVFFRSMSASVKKLQPNLIPKVKMEVCNVIAKYEILNMEHGSQQF